MPRRSGSPAMPALRRLRQEDSQESELNLGYRETLSQNKQPRFLTEFGNKGVSEVHGFLRILTWVFQELYRLQEVNVSKFSYEREEGSIGAVLKSESVVQNGRQGKRIWKPCSRGSR